MLSAAATCLLAAATVAPPLAPTVGDLAGARALSLSAYRGMPAGNDGIFFNAASLAARRRYSAELHYLLNRAGSQSDAQLVSGSVVDSQSGPVTGALAYNQIRTRGYQGFSNYLAMAVPLSNKVFLGVAGKYLSLQGPRRVQAATLDASLYLQLGRYVAVGVSGYNLVPVGHPGLTPRAVGTGVSVGTDTSFHVAADWRYDLDLQERATQAYGAGAEYLLADFVPLRVGYLRDERLQGRWWSAGTGFVTSAGVALDVSYRQEIDRPDHRTLAAALKFFLAAL